MKYIEWQKKKFTFVNSAVLYIKKVQLRMVSHGFEIEGYEIPGLDIDTVIRKGTPLVLEFTADETGVWEFICTIFCGFGHSTMRGIFVIR